jgi:hypothetical protein
VKLRSVSLLGYLQASLIDERSKQMDSSVRKSRSQLKPLIVALTLALPSAVLAAPADVVQTRADQNIDQQYGRDSVYAFSPESKPLTPERTSGSHWFHKTKASDANTSGLYEGYVPKQQESMAVNAGSGYTGSETSQADILAQPSSDVALGGEAQGNWGNEYAVVVPLANEVTPGPIAMDDGTATQFDRGYYQDPDQSEIIIVIPDNVAMTGDQTGSAEEQGSLAGTE